VLRVLCVRLWWSTSACISKPSSRINPLTHFLAPPPHPKHDVKVRAIYTLRSAALTYSVNHLDKDGEPVCVPCRWFNALLSELLCGWWWLVVAGGGGCAGHLSHPVLAPFHFLFLRSRKVDLDSSGDYNQYYRVRQVLKQAAVALYLHPCQCTLSVFYKQKKKTLLFDLFLFFFKQ
jgi:hypothetical protein